MVFHFLVGWLATYQFGWTTMLLGNPVLSSFEDLICVGVRQGNGDDDIVAKFLIYKSRHAVFGRQLRQVADSQDLSEVALCRRRDQVDDRTVQGPADSVK
jgi:hypothetical protein